MFDLSRRLLKFTSKTRQVSQNVLNVDNFYESQVEIQTCGELYAKWRKEKKFWKIPNHSLKVNITYLDTTSHEISSKRSGFEKPIALVLHGAPGSYHDFRNMTSHLHKHGVRVITPNLPDFSTWPPGIFRHSAEERAQLVKDFLKEISVSKIDALICHSGSIYPGLRLCAENNVPAIKSLVMLNPCGYTIARAIKPYWFLRGLVRLCEFPLGLKLVKPIGAFMMKVVKYPVRGDHIMDPILSGTVMCYADFPQAKENLKSISSKVPILFAFTEDDKLIEKHLSYDMTYLLGAGDDDIFYYDGKGKLLQKGVEKPLLKVIVFQEGSHYVFWKHPDIVNEAVTSFIKRIHKKQS